MKRLLPIVILSLIALLLYLEFHKNIKPSSGDSAYLNSIRNYRSKKDDYMRTDQGSPFAASKTAFTRLKYFEIDPSYKIQATLDLLPAQEKVNIAMSDGTTESFSKYGSVSFTLGNSRQQLVIYQSDHDKNSGNFFLPFYDETSAFSTYGGGRYLDVEYHGGSGLVLDFNLAYNPFCAYVEGYSCPLPPAGNKLSVAVSAGEKKYKAD